jgi:endonuclease G
MPKTIKFKGYREDFLGKQHLVPLPKLSQKQLEVLAPVADNADSVLHYQNYSLMQNAVRRFPFFAATNVDGNLFRQLPRYDRWRLDPRISRKHQWGPRLYKADKSDFDRGHMTKREDTQWGRTDEEAKAGATSTFYYTNAVPQVAKLNQNLWRGLEDYILKNNTISQDLKINLFTGPVLSDTDPIFITEVEGQTVRIPTLFWKLIYFAKSDGQLYKAGFLMGQEDLLEQQEIVIPREKSRNIFLSEEEKLFMDFKQADIYQVNIATIETLTKLKFAEAVEPFKDKRSTSLIRKEVQGRDLFGEGEPSFIIEGLTL